MIKPPPASGAQKSTIEQHLPHVDVERIRAELCETGVEEGVR
jgi:hypothetical protein